MATDILTQITEMEAEIDKLQGSIAPFKEWNGDPVPLSVHAKTQHRPPIQVRETKKQRTLLSATNLKLSGLDWASDSRHIAACTQDGKLIIWDAVTCAKDALIIPDLTSWFMFCQFSPSSRLLASGGLDNACSLYKLPDSWEDAADAECPLVGRLGGGEVGHTAYVGCARWVDEQTLLTSSGDRTVIMWDIQTKTVTNQFFGHKGGITKFDKLSDNTFVTASLDQCCKVWDVRAPGNMCIATFPGHTGQVNDARAFPGGLAFGTCSDDSTCRLFDIRTLKQMSIYAEDPGEETLPYIAPPITCVNFSATGALLFAGQADGSVVAWDTPTGEFVHEMVENECTTKVIAMERSPDGTAIATATMGKPSVFVWA